MLLHAYLDEGQNEIIPWSFDIEHIFPKKWQNTNYHGWNYNDAQAYLDRFGNKIILEKKLNIQAGNGYFGIKKNKYSASKFATVLRLSSYPKNDWTKDDIENREKIFIDDLINFFEPYLP